MFKCLSLEFVLFVGTQLLQIFILMEDKKITLELTHNQYLDLVKLIFLGNSVAEEVVGDEMLTKFDNALQQVYAASLAGKGNMFITYNSKEEEYYLAEDVEDELMELLEEYYESRFWESLIMRLTLRDLQKKFSEKELQDMPEDKGNKEMEVIHNYYISEFDDNDIDNLKVVSMKKI